MPSCECCWSSRGFASYEETIHEHERRGCECTTDTIEGRILRAGRFWRDGRDVRFDPVSERAEDTQ